MERPLDSVRLQTVPPTCVVVVDDASPDPVEPFVADRYNETHLEIEVVRHEESQEVAAARTTRVKAADTGYIDLVVMVVVELH